MDRNRTRTDEDHEMKCKIYVNEQVVIVEGVRHTGAKIKLLAIEQDVCIEEDFVLSIEDEPRRTRIVADEEVIIVETDIRFIAVPDDDNS